VTVDPDPSFIGKYATRPSALHERSASPESIEPASEGDVGESTATSDADDSMLASLPPSSPFCKPSSDVKSEHENAAIGNDATITKIVARLTLSLTIRLILKPISS
jgi:hypothetical protein